MENKKQINIKKIPTKIEIGVYWYEDEKTGQVHFDFEEMANDFEQELSKLDKNAVVMCSVEISEDEEENFKTWNEAPYGND